MAHAAVIRPRIDPHNKVEATFVLAAMGLTVSNSVRLLLTGVAHDKAVPFAPLTPSAIPLAGVKDARRGGSPSFATAAGSDRRHP